MTPDLRASYDHCRRVARREARNFYYSFYLLPKEKRDAMCAIYAFMRASDDISDSTGPSIAPGGVPGPSIAPGGVPGPSISKQETFRWWRAGLEAAYRGEYGSSLIFPAFHDAARRHQIPIDHFRDLITGTEMDLTKTRYDTFEDLYKYCHHVAGVVGLVCVRLYGFSDPQALVLAEKCGIGFQLTNILRDLEEDARMGRVYLPREELDRFGYSEDELRRGVWNERFVALMRFQIDRARRYYEEARPLLGLVAPESRPALAAIIGIYRGVLEKIAARRFLVFGRRVRLSALEKLLIVARACLAPAGPSSTKTVLDRCP